MATGGNALQQGRTLSHRASRLMRLRPRVGVEPRLVGLKGGPIDEAGMMVGDEHRPLLDGKMTYPFPDGAVFIDVVFVAGFPVGVSASIHRIGQNVVDRGVGRSYPADRAKPACGCLLQRKGQPFGAEPEPDTASGAELSEALEDCSDRAGDSLIRMKQDFPILFSPNEADRQTTAQFPASSLVANASVQPCANDV